MIRDANRLHGTHGTLMCVSQDASSYLATWTTTSLTAAVEVNTTSPAAAVV